MVTHSLYMRLTVPTSAAEDGKPGASQPELPADAGSHTIERLDKLRNSGGGLSVAQIRGQLQKTMQADAAVFRSQVRLCLTDLHLQYFKALSLMDDLIKCALLLLEDYAAL